MIDQPALPAVFVRHTCNGRSKSSEERIIAGFEEIQAFVNEHQRRPLHGEDRDIFERLYAVRLEQIRNKTECYNLLKERDHQGLLEAINEDAISIAEDAGEKGLCGKSFKSQ